MYQGISKSVSTFLSFACCSGEVEFLEEPDDEKEAESEEAKALAKEVADLMRATIRLNVKVRGLALAHSQCRMCISKKPPLKTSDT